MACGKIRSKRELIRLVRVSEDTVEVDYSGKKAGRGAYLCRVWECWEKGFKGARLEQVLRVKLSGYNREQLVGAGKELIQGVD